ncbi:MAG: hypothetical protein JWP29_3254 [Rhodoferax sp.]|nr:hypothetical protein [Rhodoferax sp.]
MERIFMVGRVGWKVLRGRAWAMLWLLWAAVFSTQFATASPVLYTVYDNTADGYRAMLATADPATGFLGTQNPIAYSFGGGALAPLAYSLTGMAYGNGTMYGSYNDIFGGYRSVLTSFDPKTGFISSTAPIGISFGGGALAPLGYTLTAMAYGNGKLYGVYNNIAEGYRSVLVTVDPATGFILSQAPIGLSFGGGALAPLGYTLTGLAYSNGKLYGTYNDTVLGYRAVLATIDPITGFLESQQPIGYSFGGGALAPLGFTPTSLAYGDGELFATYNDTDLGYRAVLASIEPATGFLDGIAPIGTSFGGGAMAPLGYTPTGLAYVNDAAPGGGGTGGGGGLPGQVPEPGALWLVGLGLAGLTALRLHRVRRHLSSAAEMQKA